MAAAKYDEQEMDNPNFKYNNIHDEDEDLDSIQEDMSSSRHNSKSSHNGDQESISSFSNKKNMELKFMDSPVQNGGVMEDVQRLAEHTTTKNILAKAKKANTKKKKTSKCKAVVAVVVIFAALGGAIGAIVWYNMKLGFQPAQQFTGELPGGCTSELIMKFNDTPRIICAINRNDIVKAIMLRISYEPEAFSLMYIEDSYNLTLEGELDKENVGPWLFEFYKNPSLTNLTLVITREPARCGLSGTYILEYIDDNGIVFRKEKTRIAVKSEMSDVTLTMKQNIQMEGEDNSTYYSLTCSAKSDCHPAPIELLGVVDGQVVPLYTVNFSCIIKYSFDEGWSISCTATIPDSMMLKLGQIICRPQDGNETVSDEKQATISTTVLCDNTNEDNRCDFSCPAEIEDNYFPNTRQCDRFHRCVNNILFSFPCADGTYFDEDACACNHKSMVFQCNEDGYRPMPADKTKGCEDVN